eukprot:jgi/Mesvir1/10719/Mv13798-RA.1
MRSSPRPMRWNGCTRRSPRGRPAGTKTRSYTSRSCRCCIRCPGRHFRATGDGAASDGDDASDQDGDVYVDVGWGHGVGSDAGSSAADDDGDDDNEDGREGGGRAHDHSRHKGDATGLGASGVSELLGHSGRAVASGQQPAVDPQDAFSWKSLGRSLRELGDTWASPGEGMWPAPGHAPGPPGKFGGYVPSEGYQEGWQGDCSFSVSSVAGPGGVGHGPLARVSEEGALIVRDPRDSALSHDTSLPPERGAQQFSVYDASSLLPAIVNCRSAGLPFIAPPASERTTESLLVRHVLRMLAGIPGDVFRVDPETMTFNAMAQVHVRHLTPSSLHSLLADFVAAGTALLQVQSFVDGVAWAISNAAQGGTGTWQGAGGFARGGGGGAAAMARRTTGSTLTRSNSGPPSLQWVPGSSSSSSSQGHQGGSRVTGDGIPSVPGPTMEAFANALAKELQGVRSEVAVVDRAMAAHPLGSSRFTLLSTLARLQGPMARARLLAQIVEAAVAPRWQCLGRGSGDHAGASSPGGSAAEDAALLLSALYQWLCKASLLPEDEEHSYRTVLILFVASLRPSLDALDCWLQQGRLEDPHGEMMVTSASMPTLGVDAPSFWTSAFSLRRSHALLRPSLDTASLDRDSGSDLGSISPPTSIKSWAGAGASTTLTGHRPHKPGHNPGPTWDAPPRVLSAGVPLAKGLPLIGGTGAAGTAVSDDGRELDGELPGGGGIRRQVSLHAFSDTASVRSEAFSAAGSNVVGGGGASGIAGNSNQYSGNSKGGMVGAKSARAGVVCCASFLRGHAGAILSAGKSLQLLTHTGHRLPKAHPSSSHSTQAPYSYSSSSAGATASMIPSHARGTGGGGGSKLEKTSSLQKKGVTLAVVGKPGTGSGALGPDGHVAQGPREDGAHRYHYQQTHLHQHQHHQKQHQHHQKQQQQEQRQQQLFLARLNVSGAAMDHSTLGDESPTREGGSTPRPLGTRGPSAHPGSVLAAPIASAGRSVIAGSADGGAGSMPGPSPLSLYAHFCATLRATMEGYSWVKGREGDSDAPGLDALERLSQGGGTRSERQQLAQSRRVSCSSPSSRRVSCSSPSSRRVSCSSPLRRRGEPARAREGVPGWGMDPRQGGALVHMDGHARALTSEQQQDEASGESALRGTHPLVASPDSHHVVNLLDAPKGGAADAFLSQGGDVGPLAGQHQGDEMGVAGTTGTAAGKGAGPLMSAGPQAGRPVDGSAVGEDDGTFEDDKVEEEGGERGGRGGRLRRTRSASSSSSSSSSSRDPDFLSAQASVDRSQASSSDAEQAVSSSDGDDADDSADDGADDGADEDDDHDELAPAGSEPDTDLSPKRASKKASKQASKVALVSAPGAVEGQPAGGSSAPGASMTSAAKCVPGGASISGMLAGGGQRHGVIAGTVAAQGGSDPVGTAMVLVGGVEGVPEPILDAHLDDDAGWGLLHGLPALGGGPRDPAALSLVVAGSSAGCRAHGGHLKGGGADIAGGGDGGSISGGSDGRLVVAGGDGRGSVFSQYDLGEGGEGGTWWQEGGALLGAAVISGQVAAGEAAELLRSLDPWSASRNCATFALALSGQAPRYETADPGQSQGSGREECEDAEEWLRHAPLAAPPPVSLIVQKCLLDHIDATCRAVGSQLLTRLMGEWRLQQELRALRAIYLQGSDVLAPFLKSAFHKLQHFEKWDDDELNNWLQDALKQSMDPDLPRADAVSIILEDAGVGARGPRDGGGGARDIGGGNATASFRSQQEPAAGYGLEALERLTLEYKVGWPLGIIVDDVALQKYNNVMRFLLKVKLAKHVLYKVHRMCVEGVKAARGGAQTEVHQLQLQVLVELVHFVDTIHQYVMDRVLHYSWGQLSQSLAAATSLDEARGAHEAYLESIQRQCFAAPDRLWTLLAGRVKTILALALDFFHTSHALAACQWGQPSLITSSKAKLLQTRHSFHDCNAFLLRVLSTKLKVGHFPHLQDLVTRINFNGYYLNGEQYSHKLLLDPGTGIS